MKTAIQQTELDRLAALVTQAADGLGFARAAMGAAYHLRDFEKLPSAVQQTQRASSAADAAVTRLLALGAKRPSASTSGEVPLHLLDTPATRRLLAALDAATAAAAEVDRERGWVDVDGEPDGFGETLAGLALLVRQEVFGPGGRE